MGVLISINGWPGVGKLAVALDLADRLHARLLDNHTLFNVAIALTEYGSAAYYDAARSVRDIAFGLLLALPPETPVIFTNVIATGGPAGFAEEHWQAIRDLAARRKSLLFSVTLQCEMAEQQRRIISPQRRAHRKMRDPALVPILRDTRLLFDEGADHRIVIDNTRISSAKCADEIASWVRTIQLDV